MGFSNLLSSALTAVATLSGDPDIQRTANSANDLVVSYQTQQQQAMAERILNSPDGIIPVTEKGVTVWRTLQYDGNGDVVGFSDFNSKEEYLLLKQQELKAQQLRQQQLQAEQAQRKYAPQTKKQGDVSISDIDAYGQTLGGLERAVMACSKYRENTKPWNDCIYSQVN
ncbi:hypothetical protein JW980_07900 [Acinetobacter johnsonii]|jgi:hypothetical protein|uniref:hypothetical protein n=1 Tax=Acinetobacter TaxID=469 RepID=UPI00196B4781|nr:hypothetical protein [Acinetobacter johnsonii]MCU4327797.1 hypothetical protein [Acinetobacter johnsonii]QSE47256.1 hypothetical protein JW980_07900 [Acinetobacter johnsonii]